MIIGILIMAFCCLINLGCSAYSFISNIKGKMPFWVVIFNLILSGFAIGNFINYIIFQTKV